MKIAELRTKKVAEPKAGDTTPHDYNPGWEDLNWLKERALENGNRLVNRGYQLFIPRPNTSAKTPRDRRMSNLANQYAWDEKDPTQLKPQYDKWEKGPKELSPTGQKADFAEAAPAINVGAKNNVPPGDNKPRAQVWTSTARKLKDGTWTSGWGSWIAQNQRDWLAPKGFLYKVKPGCLVLELDSDHDAERVYHAFENLGTAKQRPGFDRDGLSSAFPWDQVNKHFDAVRHGGHVWGGSFMYGWDVESTAWFDTSNLILVGEVPIAQHDGEDDY